MFGPSSKSDVILEAGDTAGKTAASFPARASGAETDGRMEMRDVQGAGRPNEEPRHKAEGWGVTGMLS